MRELTDVQALELQVIENLIRTDVHPFEEAQGFRALLEREGAGYSIEKLASKTGKNAGRISNIGSGSWNSSPLWPKPSPPDTSASNMPC